MQKVHFIGIAGIGMSATALLLKEAGWRVTGSDAECYGPPREVLERDNVPFTLGYAVENIPEDAECFVIGRNAKLAPSENAEVRAALTSGKPVYSFPEILGQLTQGRDTIVIAGSYGKSTVAALLAHTLRHAGIDAGYFIGAEPVPSKWLSAPATLGSAKTFVLEGDEYPSAHNDPRAKFLHFNPNDVLLTSVVHDHVNIYATFAEYQKPFREFLALAPESGLVTVCADEPSTKSDLVLGEPEALILARESGKRFVTYGVKNGESEFRATNIRYGEQTQFTLMRRNDTLGDITTALFGAHNIENITGVAGYLLAREVLPFEKIRAAIADFRGVRRRLDNLTPASKVPVFEGFGSSYEKARSAIDAMRLHYASRPLVIVFEPHTFGWRNRANLAWYDDVFKGAQTIFVAPPETQGSATHDQLTHEEILRRIGDLARPYTGPEAVAQALSGNEVVLILTSGSLEDTMPKLIDIINKKFPA